MVLSITADGARPKAIVSVCRLPSHINENEPPSKTEPFRTIAAISPGHTLSIVLPTPESSTHTQDIVNQHTPLRYCKVSMKLLDIISGDFFNDYIKTNDISMRSEGRSGVEDLYTLQDGILRLEVNKPTFERLGLEGEVIQSLGRKHVKARYAIQLNLRLPAMVHGRKGFERIVRAFTEVLNEPKTWLFYNVRSPGDFTGSITAFQPVNRSILPMHRYLSGVRVPDFGALTRQDDHEAFLELLEWLSLTVLGSPRVKSNVKGPTSSDPQIDNDIQEDLSIREYRGFLHKDFTRDLLIALLKKPSIPWFAMTVHAFDGTMITIIKAQQELLVATFVG